MKMTIRIEAENEKEIPEVKKMFEELGKDPMIVKLRNKGIKFVLEAVEPS